MRLGVHGWRLQGRTGVARYLQNLLRHWTAELLGDRFSEVTLYTPRPVDAEAFGLPDLVRQRVLASGAPMLVWENTRLAAAAKDDVLFCPSFTRPLLARGPTVVTMHEAAHFVAPAMFGPSSRFYNRLYAWSARHATLVIADNERAAEEIAHYCGVPRSRVRAVPMAPAEIFDERDDPVRTRAAVERWVGGREPFFLFVGKFSGRRDIPWLLTAFARFRSSSALPHRLALVGLDPHGVDVPARVRELGLDGAVHAPGFVPDEDLALLYNAATAFVSASPLETVSLPVMEALASGTPVVCADNPGMRESCGEGALYVPGMDTPALVSAMERIARDDALRRELGAKGREHVAAFSWRRTAAETLDVLAEAAGQGRRGARRRP